MTTSSARNVFRIHLHFPFVIVFLVVFVLQSSLNAKNVHKLSFHDLEGRQTRLKDLDGQIIVLNFWATWCGPCRAELPRLAELSKQYPPEKVSFVLLSIDEKGKFDQVRKFVADQNLSLPVWVGASVNQLEDFSGVNVVPATLIVDEHGEIVRAINGEAQPDDVKRVLDWLLAGRKGEAPSARVKRY